MGIGLFRVLLAFVVIVAHTHPVFNFNMGNSTVAVRSFFVISGFYMALILKDKYHSYSLFLTNRILRIYPAYWVVLLLTIAAGVIAHFITGNWGEISAFRENISNFNPISFLTLLVSNIVLLGRDIISFTFYDPNTGLLSFQNTSPDSFTSMRFLLVPQAWTLVLEVLFYIIAPLIVNKKLYYIGFLFGLTLLVKWYLYSHNITSALWQFRFFPSELSYFILGIFSYRIYEKLKVTKYSNTVGVVATSIVILLFAFFNYIYLALGLSFSTTEWLFYISLTLFLPFIFQYSKGLRFDRSIGELSYPVYISHILVFNVTSPLIFQPYIHNNNYEALFVFIGTVIFSVLFLKFVQNPIDRYRQQRVLSPKNI